MATKPDPGLPDPPLTETGAQVPVRGFGTARRGYDRKEVDEYVAELGAKVTGLEAELQRARHGTTSESQNRETAAEELSADDAIAGLSARLTTLFSVVEREAEALLAAAKTETAAIVAEARNEGDRIHGEARREAARAIEEARASLERADRQAEQMLSLLAERRTQMLEGLRQMQARLVEVAQDLERTLGPNDPSAARTPDITMIPDASPASTSTN